MKNLLKGIVAQKLLQHHRHRRFLHKAGLAALPFLRGRSMLLLGVLALGAEYWRRRGETGSRPVPGRSEPPVR
jgi:hypothetical protein